MGYSLCCCSDDRSICGDQAWLTPHNQLPEQHISDVKNSMNSMRAAHASRGLELEVVEQASDSNRACQGQGGGATRV